MKEFFEILNEKTSVEISDYITLRFEKEANDALDNKFSDNVVDYDFELSMGKMKESSDEGNTVWKFNLSTDDRNHNRQSILEVQSAIENSMNEWSEKHEKLLNKFYDLIRINIEKNYIGRIRNGLRRVVLKNQPEIITPLDNIQIKNIEIGLTDPESALYVVEKAIPESVIIQGGGGQPVIQELLLERQETGKDFDEIISDRKAAGDENFKYVIGVKTKKAMFECYLHMHVDYSPRPKEEVMILLANK